MSRGALRAVVLAGAFLVACGGGGDPGPAPAPPAIAAFTATPPTVVAGSSSTLAWTVSGATSLSIDHGVGTVSGTSISVAPPTTTTYTLTATGPGGSASRSAAVTVLPAVASVSVTFPAPSLVLGQAMQATAVPRDADGNVLQGRSVAWSSVTEAVATVDATGLVTATGIGTTSIVATSEGRSGSADVPVTSPVVVNTLEDVASPPIGKATLRSALAAAAPGETISFDPALDGGTILLTVVGEEHAILRGEVYAGNTFAGYQDRDYGRSALYARKDVVIDASSLPRGIALRWNGGDASPARVLAVLGDLTMTHVKVSSGRAVAVPIAGGTQPYTLARGAGLAVWGTARLDRCTVSGNTSLGDPQASRDRGTYGGGIYANGLDVTDSVISGNAAIGYGAAGGGIYSVGGAENPGGRGNDTILRRSTVSGNLVRAQHGYGGGVFTLSGGPANLATMSIVNCTIARNLVEDHPDLPQAGQWYLRGGGVYMGGGSLSVIGSTIAENAVNGTPATFGGKPNLGGGGVAATIGNAHTVEDAFLRNSVVVGNTLNGVAEDWFAGSLLHFRSGGCNVVGRLDFGQILVPAPAFMSINRKRWPKSGDVEGVAIGDALEPAGARLHSTVLSAGTDAGLPAVLWYPPAALAVDRVPPRPYGLAYVDVGYQGFGVATDDFLNQVLLRIRAEYGATLGPDFGAAFGDLTGTTWYGDAVTWPSNPANAPWIEFWRDLDVELGGRLGMAGLGDDFWGTFGTGPLGAVDLTVHRWVQTQALEPTDQLGNARPRGLRGDAGAIER